MRLDEKGKKEKRRKKNAEGGDYDDDYDDIIPYYPQQASDCWQLLVLRPYPAAGHPILLFQ
jgi:hypothetical protein